MQIDQLWAPWRLKYVAGKKPEGCVFCEAPKQTDDKETKVLYRGENIYIIMNRFPYSNGHLLIVPYRHVGDFLALTSEESHEIMDITHIGVQILKTVCNADGFNIGFNLGVAAGAGVPDHLHQHIVPRWNGDTGFMTTFGDVKVIPEDLDTTYDKLKSELEKVMR